MSEQDVNQWYKEVVDAVAHRDAAPAFRLLKEWDMMVALFPSEWTSNAQFQRDLPVLKNDLRYTAFPELSLVDAQAILSSEILSCLQREIDLESLLLSRFTSVPYGSQEKERQALKQVILKNTELIGTVSIGEWLTTFDKLFKPDERDENGVNAFMTRESRVASLGKNEQTLLRFVLEMYDKYLATEVLSVFDVAYILSGQSAQPTRGNTSPRSSAGFGGQSTIVRLPLLQALSKYEQLGNQLITQGRIKLKSQPETVRPSLLYWIKYYRDELGVGHHSSVERGNFLFRSENGKKLTPEERERVNLVLKSVEENYPVEVDTEQNVVIFPPFVPQGAPQPLPVPPLAPQKTAPQPRMIFQPSRPTNLTAPQEGGLTFTTNHVMPGEREENRGAAPGATTARPVRSSTPAPKANPFHIRPVSMGKEE